MYVHLGGNCLIRSAEIIGIFSKKENEEFYRLLKNDKGKYYEVKDISEDSAVDSIILTEKAIYLSAISTTTLQKRINLNIIYHNGGNNG